MALKIAGYTAPDQETADFEYPTAYGTITITAKRVSKHNVGFRKAFTHLQERAQRRKKIAKGGVDEGGDREFIALYYDHVVIDWRTTIEQEDAKGNKLAIESTKENFIDLLDDDSTKGVFALFMEDVAEDENFRSETEGTDMGNSPAPSDGSSAPKDNTKNG